MAGSRPSRVLALILAVALAVAPALAAAVAQPSTCPRNAPRARVAHHCCPETSLFHLASAPNRPCHGNQECCRVSPAPAPQPASKAAVNRTPYGAVTAAAVSLPAANSRAASMPRPQPAHAPPVLNRKGDLRI